MFTNTTFRRCKQRSLAGSQLSHCAYLFRKSLRTKLISSVTNLSGVLQNDKKLYIPNAVTYSLHNVGPSDLL